MYHFSRNRRHSAGSLGATLLFATFALLAEGADLSPGRPLNTAVVIPAPKEVPVEPHHVAGAFYPDEHPQTHRAASGGPVSMKTVLVAGFGGLAAASFAGSIAFWLLGLTGQPEVRYSSDEGGIEL